MKLRSRLAIATLLLAAIGLAIYWQQQRSAAQRRLEAWEARQVEEAIPAAWDQSFAWEKADLALGDFADLVAKTSGLAVELDEAGIAANRSWQVKPREIAVHVPSGEYPLHVLLRVALSNGGLVADLRGQQVVITAQASSTMRTRMQTVVYPLPQPMPEGLDEATWQSLISGTVEGHVEAVPGALVVVENALGHRRVRATIDAICRLDQQTPLPMPQPFEIPLVDAAQRQRLFAALAEPVRWDLVETRLDELVRHLTLQHRVPVLIDARTISDAGVSVDTPITKRLHDISLQSALRLILSELELTFVLRDDAILITTPEQDELQPRIVAYPVDDLLGESPGESLTELTDLLRHVIAPQSWGDTSGHGMIKTLNGNWLLVQNRSDVQAELTGFLGLLRQALASQHFDALPARSAQPQQAIRAALDRTIKLGLSGEQLKGVIGSLQDLLAIPLIINTKKLDEAGVSIDMRVNVPLTSGRAGLYLDLSLEQLELVAIIRDEVLLITTPEDAESQLDTRLYDTRALLKGTFDDDRDGLYESIIDVVHPQLWDGANGLGARHFFRNILVVSQTQEVHRDLEWLLAALDKHCTASGDNAAERPWIVPVDARPEQLRLEELLGKVISVQIENQPLEDALVQLAKEHGFHVIVDHLGLKDAGFSLPLAPESLTASEISLGGALDRLLAPQRLGYVLRENVIFVTTAPLAEDRFEVRMYRTSDLVPGRWRSAAELEQGLRAAAAGSAATKASMERDGVATIEPEWLILRGSQRFHRWVAAWLAEMRTLK